jgi:hypothetical protein
MRAADLTNDIELITGGGTGIGLGIARSLIEAGRLVAKAARGSAETVGMNGVDEGNTAPIPHGMAWNMVYDADAPHGHLPEISHNEFWSRLEYFLKELVPVERTTTNEREQENVG